MTNNQTGQYIFKLFLGWLIAILLIAFFGLSNLPTVSEGRFLSWPTTQFDYWLRWANWDGGHFRGIAENGYLPFQVVFFPLYPFIIKALFHLGLPSLWGGLITSFFATFIALIYLFKLTLIDYSLEISKKTVFLLLAFPTSFYLVSVYSESLFLALTVSSFYYARKNNYLLATILAGLSAVTRLAGVGLILAIAVEYYLSHLPGLNLKEIVKFRLARFFLYLLGLKIILELIKNAPMFVHNWLVLGIIVTMTSFFDWIVIGVGIGLCLFMVFKYFNYKKIITHQTLFFTFSILPFIFYLGYLYITQNDSFAFVSYEKQWGRALSSPWDTLVTRYNYLLSRHFFQGPTGLILVEFLSFILFFITCIYCLIKGRISYFVFCLFALFLPIFTGTLTALHRYGLILFPTYLMLAQIKNEHGYNGWLYISIALLGVMMVMFFNGYWVS